MRGRKFSIYLNLRSVCICLPKQSHFSHMKKKIENYENLDILYYLTKIISAKLSKNRKNFMRICFSCFYVILDFV